MTTGDDVDRLYQLPLGEFTAKRNELLKKATGAAKEELRTVQKPTLPAWAVNQLYWRRRKAFDKVMEAARKLRVEHGRQLSGKAAEVALAEARHREAMKAASDEIRALLKEAGEQDTPATLLAVSETLQGLPGAGVRHGSGRAGSDPWRTASDPTRSDPCLTPGRLTRPLKPQGFEALTGLVTKSSATIARLSEAAKPGLETRPAAAAKADAARKKKETAALDRQLRTAEVDERAARAEFSRAEMALARLQRERKELQERVDGMTSRRDQAARDLDERKRAVDRAAIERERIKLLIDRHKR